MNDPSDPRRDERKSESTKNLLPLEERGWEGIKTVEGQVE